MNRVLFVAVSLFILGAPSRPPAAAPQEHTGAATHHACLEEERQAIERGEGFGMALVADRNGYPGPRHILELKEKLKLAADQEREVAQLFEKMQASAAALGKDIAGKEAALDRLFAEGIPDEAAVRGVLAELAALRAELRWVHISAHLEAHGLLTPEQRHAYHAARHGAARHAH